MGWLGWEQSLVLCRVLVGKWGQSLVLRDGLADELDNVTGPLVVSSAFLFVMNLISGDLLRLCMAIIEHLDNWNILNHVFR